MSTLPLGASPANPSRRGLLAGLAATPVCARAFPISPRSGWDDACLAELRIRANYEAFDRNILTPASDRYEALRETMPKHLTADHHRQLDALDYNEVQQRFDELVDAHHDAMVALLATPAPDTAALSYKLRLMLPGDVFNFSCFDDKIAPTLTADAERFGGRA